jgi:hypothetical protein
VRTEGLSEEERIRAEETENWRRKNALQEAAASSASQRYEATAAIRPIVSNLKCCLPQKRRLRQFVPKAEVVGYKRTRCPVERHEGGGSPIWRASDKGGEGGGGAGVGGEGGGGGGVEDN